MDTIFSRRWAAVILAAVCAAACPEAWSQAPRNRSVSLAPGFEPGLPVEFDAAQIEYVGDSLIGRKGVNIRQGTQVLTADEVQYHTKTGEAFARGNVVFMRADGTSWRGEELSYNYRTGMGDFGAFEAASPPYRIFGGDASMPERNVVFVKDVVVTTCKGDPPWEFEVHARDATLRDQRYLRARHAVAYLGPVPVMYWPVYNRDLQAPRRWDLQPGMSSRLGPYLLAHYNYGLNDDWSVRGRTGGHFLAKRGVGLQQEVLWATPDRSSRGLVDGFFIDDQRMYRDERDREDREPTLDDSLRYRFRAFHTEAFDDRNWFSGDATYLSDPYLNQDFFRRDYRVSPQPENRATYQYRGDALTASLQLNARLNDFYTNVDRLPEVRVGTIPVPLGDSGFYYESDSSATFLRRVVPKLSSAEEYDAFRVDTTQMIFYPGRYFGFLGFTPRAGYRGTYYSATRGPVTSVTTNAVDYIGADGLPATSNVVTRTRSEEGADIRHLPEIGFDASFKAFRVFDEGENVWGQGLRHVIEPYSIYTLTPEPDLRPWNIYQFDAIDRLDRDHTVTFGLRNKIQTRRRAGGYLDHDDYQEFTEMDTSGDAMDSTRMLELPETGKLVAHDLIRTDIFSFYRMQKYPEQNDFGPLGFDVELRPGAAVRLRSRGKYDTYESELTEWENQFSWRTANMTAMTLSHVYRAEGRNSVTAVLDLFPRAKWALRIYERFDLEESRLQEHSYLLRHRMDCVGWGIGVRHEPGYDGEDDDYRIWVQLWLLDLPNMRLRVGG